jgi:hypothetical protein
VLKGQIKLGPEFDEPLPLDILESFDSQLLPYSALVHLV